MFAAAPLPSFALDPPPPLESFKPARAQPLIPPLIADTRPGEPRTLVPDDTPAEMAVLREEFNLTVRDATLARLAAYQRSFRDPKAKERMAERMSRISGASPEYLDYVARDAAAQLAQTATAKTSQFFLYVDRNPVRQTVFVGYLDGGSGRVWLLGPDLVSSGDLAKGGDYFETPTGVFAHLVDNFGYRALGTPNAEGWRGLGEKDSRVWDFGFVRGIKSYKGGTTLSQMRLLVHATDPVAGEQRLGRIDSKGCIRISKGLNAFLDRHGLLDLHYEEWAKTRPGNWLLRKDREPVGSPGQFLVIGDSAQAGETRTAAKSPAPPSGE